MAIEWWRSWHGAPTDAKWIVVAQMAKTSPGHVAAVWYALQDHASQARPRGSIAGFDVDTLAAFYRWKPDVIRAVVTALTDKKLIEGDFLTAWANRQPKKEDDSSERVKRFREAKMQDVTPRNAVKRSVTVDKEKRREDKEKKKEGALDERLERRGEPEHFRGPLTTELRRLSNG